MTFNALFQHLAAVVPGIAHCPVQPTLTFEEACDIQGGLQYWMQQLVLIPSVPQTPVMRNFLCAEANLPPPGIEIKISLQPWRVWRTILEDQKEGTASPLRTNLRVSFLHFPKEVTGVG